MEYNSFIKSKPICNHFAVDSLTTTWSTDNTYWCHLSYDLKEYVVNAVRFKSQHCRKKKLTVAGFPGILQLKLLSNLFLPSPVTEVKHTIPTLFPVNTFHPDKIKRTWQGFLTKVKVKEQLVQKTFCYYLFSMYLHEIGH